MKDDKEGGLGKFECSSKEGFDLFFMMHLLETSINFIYFDPEILTLLPVATELVGPLPA
jgi:NADH:ubiquinone oxidoreductase subunit 3 (subunit A)